MRAWSVALALVLVGATAVAAAPASEPALAAVLEEALTAAQAIRQRHLETQRETLLAEIAVTLAAAGDLTRSGDLVARLPDSLVRVETWLAVARAQNRAGHRHAATVACHRVLGITREEVGRWGRQLGDTAAELAAAGAVDEALATAALLEQRAPSAAALAYRGIAAQLARVADLDGLRRLERSLAGGSFLVTAVAEGRAAGQAAAGDIAGALRTIAGMPAGSARALLLVEVAGVQVRRGDRAGAQANLERARAFFEPLGQDPQVLLSAKDGGLRAIAAVEIAAGDLEAAGRTAAGITHLQSQATVLVEIARALAERGDRPAALAQLTEAWRLAREIEFRAARAAVLQQIGQAQALAGDRRGALRIAEQANADILQPDIYEAIAVAYANAGDLVGALAAARDAPGGPVLQARVLQALTRSLAGRGADQPARTVAVKQDHPLVRARALLGIAQGRLEREVQAANGR